MTNTKKTFTADFRRFFGRGLAILLPSVLTLWILVQAYIFVEARVADPINASLRQAVLWVVPRTVSEQKQPSWFRVTSDDVARFRAAQTPQGSPESQRLGKLTDEELKSALRAENLRQYWDGHWYYRAIGLVAAVILIYLAGLLLGGLIGKQLYLRAERYFSRIPIVKLVYPHVKQLVDLVLGDKPLAFSRVVLVEFPRLGTWSMAFVTAGSMKSVREAAAEEVLTVFLPTTPTPFMGYTLLVRRSEVLEVDVTVDEAIRFILTAGVLLPAKQAEAVPVSIGHPMGAGGGAGGGGTLVVPPSSRPRS